MINEAEIKGLLREEAIRTTQKEVAKKMNVSPPFISAVLLGRRVVTKRLAKAMGYSKVVMFIPLKPSD